MSLIHSSNDVADTHRALKKAAHPLTGGPTDFDALLALVGNAQYVLIGDGSHGTHEFYHIRAEITKRLIRERGFNTVAVEADWPDAYRVNRYIRGEGDDADAEEALRGFVHFPQWMWRNADVLDFIGWLRSYNDSLPPATPRVGFYGLDLYSLHASIAAVLEYLDIVDPEAAHRARARYGCFDSFDRDGHAYAYATIHGLTEPCESDVVRQLAELQRAAARYAQHDGRAMHDALFYAEQNARLLRNAERYYRAMFHGGPESWNLRDHHMAETLDALSTFLVRQRIRPKIVVWAHNSHLGDARATSMALHGEVNLGRLVRARHGRHSVTIGLMTYAGTVTAADTWGNPAQRKVVRAALPESYEALFHRSGLARDFLNLRESVLVRHLLDKSRLERMIGVIYTPDTERQRHYVAARVTQQFDGIFHYDTTRAVEPLERSGAWSRGEVPETYPSAL